MVNTSAIFDVTVSTYGTVIKWQYLRNNAIWWRCTVH